MGANEMTVYVVVLGWRGDGATVTAVADNLASAQDLAERGSPRSGTTAAEWTEWREDTRRDVATEGKRWERTALEFDGGEHAHLYQEIVTAPMTLTPGLVLARLIPVEGGGTHREQPHTLAPAAEYLRGWHGL